MLFWGRDKWILVRTSGFGNPLVRRTNCGFFYEIRVLLQGMFCVTHVTRDSCYTFSVPHVKSSIDGYVGGNTKMTTLLSMDI